MSDCRIKLVGGTHDNINDALIACGKYAATCYAEDDWQTIYGQSNETALKRAKLCIDSGHHSVFEHASFTFSIENVPKLFAMLLNNGRLYATSEKSARFTKMSPSGHEKALYEKWDKILNVLIAAVANGDSRYDKKRIKKLAQENARYMISVFTPTSMIYSINLRRLSYLRYALRRVLELSDRGTMLDTIRPTMRQFLEQTDFLGVDEMYDNNAEDITLFADKPLGKEVFSEKVYAVTYRGSFAQYAQAHRHRTINYQMLVDCAHPKFYVPPIVDEFHMVDEWLSDINSVSELRPQGELVRIIEWGGIDDFKLKLDQRLCSEAQLEISRQTYDTCCRLMQFGGWNLDMSLEPFKQGARCLAGYECQKHCGWGGHQIERLV